jgi:uncharacterized membrane-anchored protein
MVVPALVAVLGLGAGPASAAAPSADAEAEAAFAAAGLSKQDGPSTVKLLDQASLAIPAGQTFIPQPAAGQLMKAMGNRADERLQGVVMPLEGANWIVVVKYEKAGYIKDDDAKDWNADDLLKGLKEGTEASNEERRQRGFPEIEVSGWAEKPAYEASTHRLVWAAIARGKGTNDANPGVNYNTYALGREGFMSLNLVTALKDLPGQRAIASDLLGKLEFVDGKRYADFNSSTDKVAEYGLAALVAGVAAKKVGLFALIALWAVKFWKIIALAVIGLGALLPKWLKRRKDNASV